MQGSKETSWSTDYDSESVADSELAANDSSAENVAATTSDGWQQYRHWISKAPAPRGRRMGVDPSIYTWKGYRSWSEQIKRNWSDS